MRKKLFILSGISIIISILTFGVNYYFFHYVTSEGFTLVFHQEVDKPFLTDLIGQFGVHFLFLAVASFLVGLICFPRKDK